MSWDITVKKASCSCCCKGGNALFDLVRLSGMFVWKCRNCGVSYEAEGIQHDDANIGIVWAKQLDENGRLE